MKQITIKLLIIVSLVLFLYLLLQNINIEGFTDVIFKNWWADPVIDSGTIAIFHKLFGDLKKYDTVEIHSVFKEALKEKDPNKLYVQYSGEAYYHEPSLYNINFIPIENTANNIVFPLGSFQTLEHVHNKKYDINYFINKRKLDKHKPNFCLFCVSNGGCKERNDFFNELSKYKKVDSCGKHLNNGVVCPGNHLSTEYFDFISNYKFMICFENTSKPNYFTEKLVNSYYSGSIPIYWGDPNISKYINMDSILYLKPGFTQQDVDDLINKIKELDTNDELYKEKYEQSFFKDGVLTDEFNLDKVKEKIETIIEENDS